MSRRFVFFSQQDQKDCGPTCLRMLCKYHGLNISIQKLRELCHVDRSGSTMLALSEAAEKIGFQTSGVKGGIEPLMEAELPVILYWGQNHYVVLFKIKNGVFHVANPSTGIVKLTLAEFRSKWLDTANTEAGVALLLRKTSKFQEQPYDPPKAISWSTVLRYFYNYRFLFLQLLLGLGIGTLLSIITPFLTQAIVDVGIDTKDIDFVYLILISQLMLFVGSTSVNFIRSWILLHISTRVNLSILTDFLIKIMKLPMVFFESKTTGDIMQRMNDQRTIENFLTGTALNAVFSMINLVVFTGILWYYNGLIFGISFLFTILYAAWITLFLKRRRDLNFKQFENASNNQNSIVELVRGMQEIKLNNCENDKRWAWERVQAKLFNFQVESLTLNQMQHGGSMFINQIKNILITFLSVKAVISGQITLGGMMAIQYIVGQITSPVEQMLGFVQSYQDAQISLERLNEIHQLEEEEPAGHNRNEYLPADHTITLEGINFTYPGVQNEPVLRDIDLIIPHGKTTAIVGMSGSGKTTLLKLLLRFYNIEKGQIRIGSVPVDEISLKTWRSSCGTVLQDGFIFSDTIEKNIAIHEQEIDKQKMEKALWVANIADYIGSLPFGSATKIGSAGNGLSQGQKQRLLIARAVYKDPEFLFFDEATNALDANNERTIMKNLNSFFRGRTVVIVAHRLSTVSSADHIVVIDKGKIIEQGDHLQLTALKGAYYGLVKDQLELGI